MQSILSLRRVMLLWFASLTIAGAGTPMAPAADEPPATATWCEWLQNDPGELYKDKGNHWLESLTIGGRFHYQAGHIDGTDVNGRDFNDSYDEYRRARLELKSKFLTYFSIKSSVNLVNDERRNEGDLDWGYDTFDEAIISLDLKKLFAAEPFEKLSLNYGRFKFNMTEEMHMSSKEIYTLERSAMTNKLAGAQNRPTGMTLDAQIGDTSMTLGIFSGEDDSEFIGGWNDGLAYYLSVSHTLNDEWRLIFDGVMNDPSGEDDFLAYDWATALSAVYEKDQFGLLSTLVVGENNSSAANRGGSFHSLTLMPWYWVVEKRLQAVCQYHYAGASQSEGMRTNSRYFRSAHSPGVNVNGGRGDELHTLYLGLNYHLCGHQAKIMGGIEYTSLETPAGEADALTYSIAFRTYF